jgi:hypothetical protein
MEFLSAGQTKPQMFLENSAVSNMKELQKLELGAICSRMSKQAYLSDRDGHWHPTRCFSFLSARCSSSGASDRHR